MTSKNSFFKLLWEDLRQRLWSIILAMVVIILPITIVVLLQISSAVGREIYWRDVEACFKDDFPWYYLVAVVGAFICACCSFGYLFSKKKVDFFHGLPVGRTKQFAMRYVSGVLVYLVPNLLMLLTNAVIIAAAGGFSVEMAKIMFHGLCYHLLGFLVMYSAFCICIFLVGNLFVLFAVAGWMFAYVPAAVLLYEGMREAFYKTYSYQNNSFFDLMKPFRFFSPFYYYCGWMPNAADRGGIGAGVFIFQNLFYLAVLVVLGYVLYRIRPSEGAGKAIVFSWAKPLVRISSELIIGVGAAFLFYGMVGNQRIDSGWIVFGGILGVVLSHMFIESVLHYDVRKCFADKLSMAAAAVVAVAFTLGMRYDVTGYDTYLPKQKQIVSADIQTEDTQSRQIVSGEYRTSVTMTDMNLLYPFLKECRNRNMENSYEGATQTVRFVMRLKNGKQVYRRYVIPEALFEAHYGVLFNSAEYKADYLKGIKALMQTPERLQAVSFSMEEHTLTYSDALTTADKKELLAALTTGYERMDWQTRYYTAPRFLIELQVDYAGKADSHASNRIFRLPVYDCYTETIAFAKRKGFRGLEARDWSKVESVTLAEGYSYTKIYPSTDMYLSEEENDIRVKDYGEILVDRKDWERLYELCVWDELLESSVMNTMHGYYVTIKVYTDAYGNFVWNQYRIKKGADLSFLQQ